jgi:hypothetical protein
MVPSRLNCQVPWQAHGFFLHTDAFVSVAIQPQLQFTVSPLQLSISMQPPCAWSRCTLVGVPSPGVTFLSSNHRCEGSPLHGVAANLPVRPPGGGAQSIGGFSLGVFCGESGGARGCGKLDRLPAPSITAWADGGHSVQGPKKIRYRSSPWGPAHAQPTVLAQF